MAILYPDRFKAAQPAGFDGVFDWDFLLPAFPRRIQPMDWDGVVEINHRFLVFETKEPGLEIPVGQEICLKRAVMTGRFTVIIVFGKTALEIRGFEIWSCRNGEVFKKRFNGGNARELLVHVGEWTRHAETLFRRSGNGTRLDFNLCQACGQRVNGWEI